MSTEHSLERIFLTLTDSCPLPVGWACLRPPDNERNILFAHVTVDQQLQVECDRTILLTVRRSGEDEKIPVMPRRDYHNCSANELRGIIWLLNTSKTLNKVTNTDTNTNKKCSRHKRLMTDYNSIKHCIKPTFATCLFSPWCRKNLLAWFKWLSTLLLPRRPPTPPLFLCATSPTSPICSGLVLRWANSW